MKMFEIFQMSPHKKKKVQSAKNLEESLFGRVVYANDPVLH